MKKIASIAKAALLEEAETTPKPGLVDKHNNGAHRDMDLNMFIKSANVLEPHFTAMAEHGKATCRQKEIDVLPALRELGLRAEEDMFKATNNVNTHKGAIFSVGLLCAAAGRCKGLSQATTPIKLCRISAHMTKGICKREYAELSKKKCHTNGERVFIRYGAHGARGEAENGFPSVRKYGLPKLQDYLKRGYDENTSYVRTLLSLMSNVTDTNILSRHDMNTAMRVRAQAGALHRRFTLEGAMQLDESFIADNISPGGSADLLAVSIFMHKIKYM